jgi:hypothetical protein
MVGMRSVMSASSSLCNSMQFKALSQTDLMRIENG